MPGAGRLRDRQEGGCKPYGRLNVQVEGQNDELGNFIFRTTGFNSIRTLSARLARFEAVSGGNLRYLPLTLKLRGKSTTQSHRAPVFYVDLCLRDGVSLDEAVTQAKAAAIQRESAGVEMATMELAARKALANGTFEDNDEDISGDCRRVLPEAAVEHANDNDDDTVEEPVQSSGAIASKLTKLVDSRRNENDK